MIKKDSKTCSRHRRRLLRGIAGGALLGSLSSGWVACGSASAQRGEDGLPGAVLGKPEDVEKNADLAKAPDPALAASVEELEAGSQVVYWPGGARGSYREIGETLGRLAKPHFAELRDADDAYDRVIDLAGGPFASLVADYLERTRARFPHLLEELEGMAKAMALPFDELFAWNCRAELFAAERASKGKEASLENAAAGCSTVGLKREGGLLLAHNEDGAEAYRGHMILLRATPPSGVRFLTLVYPGTIPGNGPGVNVRGVVQTTNFISTNQVTPGVPRYFIGRAVLEASSLQEATAIATAPGRAFPWHHNLASLSEARLVSVETWPAVPRGSSASSGARHWARHSIQEVEGTLLHTNHLLHKEIAVGGEQSAYVAASSRPRLEALRRRAKAKAPRTRDDALDMLCERGSAPEGCGVYRLPGDKVPGVTVATVVFESPRVEMILVEGSPCTGRRRVARP